jgi:magnesium-protoporphyrin IX monomethyl ester (oxidative) cyclase
MRVCLINPPRIQPRSWGKPNVFQPFDIAYVAAVLEINHKVQIIDAPTEGLNNLKLIDKTRYQVGLTKEQIAKKIKNWSPDVVGITIPFSGWTKPAFEVANEIKNVDKDIITILDGQHPSARPKECLKHSEIDFVVIGEKEYTILELVDSLEKGRIKNFRDIKGLAFSRNETIIITTPRPLIQDLDSLPFPARHLLPMQKYFDAVKSRPIRGVINKPWASMITSRGCPYHCVFCSIHIVWGKQWRYRSPENVVDEIEHLVNTYKIKQIDFWDDNMALNKKRMENICDLIVEKRLDIEWYTPNGLRADTLDENLLTKMKASGCKKIRIAPESGVQKVVDEIIEKNQDLKTVEKTIELCKKMGIRVGCFFVLGLIGETKEDIENTINYAYKLRKLGAEIFHFSIATPLYGTRLHEQAKKGGFLSDKISDEALSAAEPLIETPEFTADDLRKLCARANLVNQNITFDKLIKAIRHPKDIIILLFEKLKND